MPDLSCCIVTSEIAGPHLNGGVGTHCLYLADFLARRPNTVVRVVYYGLLEREDEAFWVKDFREKYGITFEWINPVPDSLPFYARLATSQFDIASMRVAEHLRKTHADIYFFQELLGLGYRSFQMKRTGVAFQDSILTCMVHSSLEWISEAMGALPQRGKTEAATKQMERSCVRSCDWLLSPSKYMLNWSQRDCEIQHPRSAAIPYLFRSEEAPIERHLPVAKLIFFGRLEQRKGLIVFLKALEILSREGGLAPVPVTLLGRLGQTEDETAEKTIEVYRERVEGRFPLTIESDKNHHEAIAYLRSNADALVVCPSLLDNMPYAIIEAICLNCNIIAANTGGIPELFGDDSRVFDPKPAVLAAKIRQALAGELPPLNPEYSEKRVEGWWEQWLAGIELPDPQVRESRPAETVNILLSVRHPDAQTVVSNLGAGHAYHFLTDDGVQGPYSFSEAQQIAADAADGRQPPGNAMIGFTEAVFIVPDGAIPDKTAPEILASGASASGAGIVSGLSRYRCPADENILAEAKKYDVDVLIGPLEPSMVLLPFGNNVGWGCHYLTPEAAAHLVISKVNLSSPENVANLVWTMLARGIGTDCVPVPIEDYTGSWPNMGFELYERARLLELVNGAIDGREEWAKHLIICTAGATVSVRKAYRRSELAWKERLRQSEIWWKDKTDHWWREYSIQQSNAARWQTQCQDVSARFSALRRVVAQRESVRYLLPQTVKRIISEILSRARGKR